MIDVMDHTGLAYKYARKYVTAGYRRGYTDEDLFQTAMLGVLKAEKAYKPGEYPFTTLATFYIKAELRKLFYIKGTSNIRPTEEPMSSWESYLIRENELSLPDNTAEVEVLEAIEKVQVNASNKKYLEEIVTYGPQDANKRLEEREGITRHLAYHRRSAMKKAFEEIGYAPIT